MHADTQALPNPRHSTLRSYMLEAQCEFLRLMREPAFGVPVIAFPAFFYLLFGVALNRGSAGAAEYLLATTHVPRSCAPCAPQTNALR